MAYVVSERCINCKFTSCVQVCPVDCFHEGPNCVVIDPDVCISCGACVPVCPTEAIFEQEDLPAEFKVSIKLNDDLSKIWPSITETKESLPEAEKWKRATGKLQYLDKKAA
ncbi:MAG: ferredoxin FdxA [Bacteriovoracales bacterium]